MNILHVITGLDRGGAEAALTRLVSADRGNRHAVVSLRDRGHYADALEGAGATVTELGMPRSRVTLTGCWRLYRVLRESKPDVIQTWLYHADLLGGIAGRAAGVRAVVWGLRAPFARALTGRATTMVVRLCAWLSRSVPAAVVANSEFARTAHRAAGYRTERFVVIPNGYPLDRFKPDPDARARFDAEHGTAGKALIGMVARVDAHKDHANLLAALRLLGDAAPTCILVGDGATSDNAQFAGDGIIALGPRDDVPAIMAALDVHVLSSAAESFPNVLAEAMACGTPCVTTDAGDARAIVGDTGWVVPPRDAAALARAIDTACSERRNHDAWRARQAACRERVLARYSMDAMVDRYNELWHAVAA